MRSFKNEEEALRFLGTLKWGNAAGTCRQGHLACCLAETGVPVVMFGSITKFPRKGNMGESFRYNPHSGNSINNEGLTNAGFIHYIEILSNLCDVIRTKGSELWVSISAGDDFIPEEYQEMANRLVSSDSADVIEGNLSCPNVQIFGSRKIPICFNLDDFNAGVKALRIGAGERPIAVKISPITDSSYLSRLTDICIKENVNYIVCSNTKADSRGGIGGKILKPIVSKMIQTIGVRTRKTKTKMIAVGGIENALDAYNYLYWGGGEVVGFQFNTAFTRRNEDPRFVGDLIIGGDDEPGLVDLLVERGLPW